MVPICPINEPPSAAQLLHASEARSQLSEHARNGGRQDRHYDYEHQAHGCSNEAILNCRRAGFVVDELLHLNLQDYSTAPGSSYNGASCAVSVNHAPDLNRHLLMPSKSFNSNEYLWWLRAILVINPMYYSILFYSYKYLLVNQSLLFCIYCLFLLYTIKSSKYISV